MVRSAILMSVQGFTPTFKQRIEIGKPKANLTEKEKNGLMEFVKHQHRAISADWAIEENKITVFGKNGAMNSYFYMNSGILRSSERCGENKLKFYPFN